MIVATSAHHLCSPMKASINSFWARKGVDVSDCIAPGTSVVIFRLQSGAEQSSGDGKFLAVGRAVSILQALPLSGTEAHYLWCRSPIAGAAITELQALS